MQMLAVAMGHRSAEGPLWIDAARGKLRAHRLAIRSNDQVGISANLIGGHPHNAENNSASAAAKHNPEPSARSLEWDLSMSRSLQNHDAVDFPERQYR